MTTPSPADSSWADPTFREIKAEELRRQRFALARRFSFQKSVQSNLLVERINARLAVCDAARMIEASPISERSHWRLNTMAKELMADHIDEAASLSKQWPNHPMVSTFLTGASQHAEHAWALRGAQTELPGPFGGLQWLAWMLSRPEAKLSPDAVPHLDAAVQLARRIPPSISPSEWSQSDVNAFVQAWAAAGVACSVADIKNNERAAGSF